ncbi:MAG TPA: restriction endonuclease subunit S [Blastocatellia bacterium]|nr:restriction endonuclease subunit S [Blastocatellia bacterium]
MDENVAIRSFAASFGSTGRLDAEFYEPKYQQLEKRLRKLGAVPLASLCLESPQRGIQPEFVEGGSVFVVASKAVRPNGVLLDDNECTNESFYYTPKNSKARLKKGDVLLNGTGRGTLGRASIYDADALAIADNHVTILRPNENVCDPYYLMLFLNSIAGQMQSEKWQCGTSGQLELYPNQIEQFMIYAPSFETSESLQKEVSRLVQDSFAARKQSNAILNVAKRGVEMAIEQDEASALEWMEQQSAT